MASTPSIVLDLGDGKDSLQPLPEFGVVVLTQSPFTTAADQTPKTAGERFDAKASIGGKRVVDADYAVLLSDTQVEVRGLTAGRTITLPDVDSFPTGQPLIIGSFDGTCSPARPITIQPGPGTGDTIGGQPAVTIQDPYASFEFRAGTTDVWIAR